MMFILFAFVVFSFLIPLFLCLFIFRVVFCLFTLLARSLQVEILSYFLCSGCQQHTLLKQIRGTLYAPELEKTFENPH